MTLLFLNYYCNNLIDAKFLELLYTCFRKHTQRKGIKYLLTATLWRASMYSHNNSHIWNMTYVYLNTYLTHHLNSLPQLIWLLSSICLMEFSFLYFFFFVFLCNNPVLSQPEFNRIICRSYDINTGWFIWQQFRLGPMEGFYLSLLPKPRIKLKWVEALPVKFILPFCFNCVD